MKPPGKSAALFLTVAVLFCTTTTCQGAPPLGTAFTYQGHLTDANGPANGRYDFKFNLYDDPCTGTQQGNTVTMTDIDVNNGHFAVELDFWAAVFTGERRWLEVEVRPADSGDYTMLGPRSELTATPYALYAKTADENDPKIGTNTVNFLPKWDGSVLVKSSVFDNGTNIGIGLSNPAAKLDVAGGIAVNSTSVINSSAQWVGSPTGLQGPEGPTGPPGRNATLVVAAVDTSPKGKASADYVCTGTDDQNVISAAINALPDVGGSVELLEGTYTLRRSYEAGTAIGAIVITDSNVWLRGQGCGTKLILADDQNCTGIRIDDGAGKITISDMYINGNRAHNDSVGIYECSGIKAKSDNAPYPHDIVVERCFIEECADYCVGLDGPGMFVRNNRLGNAGRAAAEVCGGPGELVGNYLEFTGTSTLYGLEIQYGSFIKVVDNIINIKTGAYISIGIASDGYGRNFIANNTINAVDGPCYSYAILVQDNRAIITGNVICGNPEH